jgi:hypothetical protein
MAFDMPQLRANRARYLMNANQGAWQKYGIWSGTPADDVFNKTPRS